MKYPIAFIITLFLVLIYVIVSIFYLLYEFKILKYGDLYYYTTIEPDVIGDDPTRFHGEFYKCVEHPHSIITHFISIIKRL